MSEGSNDFYVNFAAFDEFPDVTDLSLYLPFPMIGLSSPPTSRTPPKPSGKDVTKTSI
jgi:hypothetical protein